MSNGLRSAVYKVFSKEPLIRTIFVLSHSWIEQAFPAHIYPPYMYTLFNHTVTLQWHTTRKQIADACTVQTQRRHLTRDGDSPLSPRRLAGQSSFCEVEQNYDYLHRV